jgi:hypothetical protein
MALFRAPCPGDSAQPPALEQQAEQAPARIENLGAKITAEVWIVYVPKVTDRGLEHLYGLTALQRLEMRGTSATPAGLEGLRRALSKTAIGG